MTIQYGILFRLSVTHDFYDGNPDQSVVIRPTPDTQRLMNNYRMLAKMNRGKLEIGAEVESTENGPALIDRIQEPMELMFTIEIQDPYWVNYTDPLPDRGHVYYFSNRDALATEDRVLLHAEPNASKSDQIVMTSHLSFQTESEVTLTRKGIEDEDRSAAIKMIQNQQIIDARNLQEGLFETAVDGQNQQNILSQAATTQGVMQIYVSPTAEHFIKVVNEDWILQSPDFSAHFTNKKSVWRYHFTQQNLEHMEGIQITNGGDESPFGAPEETTGPDGKTWILISSTEPLAITSNPTQFLQLKKNMNIENRSEGVVIDRLPVPSKENLYRVGEDGTILTDLFINL